MAPSAFLFDLDGTILDSYPWYAQIFAKNGTLNEEAVLKQLKTGESILKIAETCQIPVSRITSAYKDLPLFPDVRETLANLAEQKLPLGIVTNLPESLVMQILDKLGLEQFFPVVIHAGNCSVCKPDPMPLLLALENLTVKRSTDVFYVGDTETDGVAASRAGLSFAWASYGYYINPPKNPTVVLTQFRDLLTF